MDAEVLNILVIDDDPVVQTLLCNIIASAEHQVVAVSSAEEGLELLPFWTFQVALVDHHLPGMDGLVLGEYLRRNNPDMTIALITGDDDLSLPRKSRNLQIEFIQKPFEKQQILRLIDSYIEGANERQEQRLQKQDVEYAPPLATYVEEISAAYRMPNIPSRIEDRVLDTLKRSLNNLRLASRYTERDRIIALAGLLSARVLGLVLPRNSEGLTLYQEYDHLMRERGRRPEFEEDITPE